MRYNSINEAFTHLNTMNDKLNSRHCPFIKKNCILVKCTCFKAPRIHECSISTDTSTPTQFSISKPACSRIKEDIFLSIL